MREMKAKDERRKEYEASIRKWEEIKKKVYAEEKDEYLYKYWNPCGYCQCHAHEEEGRGKYNCGSCPLNQGIPLPYCSDEYTTTPSIAFLALQLSDARMFNVAEQLIDILLRKMESDIANLFKGEIEVQQKPKKQRVGLWGLIGGRRVR